VALGSVSFSITLSYLYPSIRTARITQHHSGNASGISDGAGAIVLASEAAASKHNLKPIARVLGYHISGASCLQSPQRHYIIASVTRRR
jgi:acetyl-CoA acetyltransferase